MRYALSLAFLLALLLPSAASAKRRDTDGVWATVNVCDSPKQPETIGIRAAMPATPKGARLSMRFRVQYRDDTGAWVDVDDADSGWRVVGTAKGVAVESGWSFNFTRPSHAVTLRGVVKFRWRRGSTLPRSAETATEAGHRSSAGADPAGYSAATCTIG
ncbi:MAG TPA: hypothetical protein VNS09_27205 [Solirubrobacter sp.]|nr:hypothetical protein [Solirubrobacter sp.]